MDLYLSGLSQGGVAKGLGRQRSPAAGDVNSRASLPFLLHYYRHLLRTSISLSVSSTFHFTIPPHLECSYHPRRSFN
jgi:hypothetical protein